MMFRVLQTATVASFLQLPASAAEPQSTSPGPGPSAKVESLTAAVRQLLSETSPSFPDPWKPHRERPREFRVLPGEKLSYAERLTAMEATITEIRAKRREGQPLLPNRGSSTGGSDSGIGDGDQR